MCGRGRSGGGVPCLPPDARLDLLLVEPSNPKTHWVGSQVSSPWLRWAHKRKFVPSAPGRVITPRGIFFFVRSERAVASAPRLGPAPSDAAATMSANKKAGYSPAVGIPDGVYNFGPRCVRARVTPLALGSPPQIVARTGGYALSLPRRTRR